MSLVNNFIDEHAPKFDPTPDPPKPKTNKEVYNKLLRAGKSQEASLYNSGHIDKVIESLLD